MAIRYSWMSPRLALIPAMVITAVAFVGAIGWTIYISFTKSRRFPNYDIYWENFWRQYKRLFNDPNWETSINNLIFMTIGSALAILFGFILAVLVNKEKTGEGVFRTIYLYPLAVSFIVAGIVWRWMFNPVLGIENFLIELGFENASFNWLAHKDTAMWGVIIAIVWHGMGFYLALMLAGLKSINDEIWNAAKLDGISPWKFYTEIVIPMLKFTFLTCAILLSLGVVKTYDIVLAMTGGGPGTSSWTPAYFVVNAYATRGNMGYASSAAFMMLLITFAIFLPLVLLTRWQTKRKEKEAV
ncbi:MAG: sugar ABC transporter permease [Hyphomicrobiales bacterium]|nr:MAG: sugar ABC transporter permease [Hyphomicrobiales bacterium]